MRTVHVLGLGGTIAMSSPAGQPSITPAELVAGDAGLDQVADVRTRTFRQVPSADLRLSDAVELALAIEDSTDNADGIVVTHGTDTLEETAFALSLLLPAGRATAVTGAMRTRGEAGYDGQANLGSAIRVAASDAARGLGPVVVFDGTVYPAYFARKEHSQSIAGFSSTLGPIGWVGEGRVEIPLAVRSRLRIPARELSAVPPVALVTMSLGDDGRILQGLPGMGFAGLVVEGLGGGHVPSAVVPHLADLARGMPVVLAAGSRTGVGLESTYTYPGSESDLLSRGLVAAGWLDAKKARILLSLLLAWGIGRDDIARYFFRFRHPG